MVDTVRLRDAPVLGLSRGVLRGRRWRPISQGLYEDARLDPDERRRLAALAKVLPANAAWSHLTGARLLQMWLTQLPASVPATATIQPGQTRPEREGLYVTRSRARSFAPLDVDGLPVVPPPLLLGQLAEDLSLLDLVVAVDAALHLRWCTAEDIVDAVLPGQRGARNLLAAAALADGRSESPWETVLRLFHCWCGFTVEPQHSVRDSDGNTVARADLWIVGTRRLAEYDGADHRDRDRHRADLARDKTLARLGLERYGYTANEIVRRPTRVLRDAEEALGLAHEPRRLSRWLVEHRRSSLSADGRLQLAHRLRRFDNCRSAPSRVRGSG